MSYNRKREEKRRLKHLHENCDKGWPMPVYWNEKRGCWKRYWKASSGSYAMHKKRSRKKCRLYLKKHDVYTKKAYDLWWSAY